MLAWTRKWVRHLRGGGEAPPERASPRRVQSGEQWTEKRGASLGQLSAPPTGVATPADSAPLYAAPLLVPHLPGAERGADGVHGYAVPPGDAAPLVPPLYPAFKEDEFGPVVVKRGDAGVSGSTVAPATWYPLEREYVLQMQENRARRGVRRAPVRSTELELRSVLGRGAFGVTFLGAWRGRAVAVKVVHKRSLRSARARARALVERHAMARMGGRGAPRLLATCQDASRLYYVSAYVEGTTLREALAAGPLPLARARTVARGLVRALATLHAHGFVHRDVKPENVLLARGDRVRLLDYGLAKLVAPTPDAPTLLDTGPGSRAGTPLYMSPEVYRGGVLTPAADFWSLGVVLAEMVHGEVPLKALYATSRLQDGSAHGQNLVGKMQGGRAERPTFAEHHADGVAMDRPLGDNYAQHGLADGLPRGHHAQVPSVGSGATTLYDAPIERSPEMALFDDMVGQLLRARPEARPTAARLLRHPFWTQPLEPAPPAPPPPKRAYRPAPAPHVQRLLLKDLRFPTFTYIEPERDEADLDQRCQ